MTSPRLAYVNSSGERMYSNPNNKRVDYLSVTNVLGIVSKPFLIPWAASIVADTATWLMQDFEDYVRNEVLSDTPLAPPDSLYPYEDSFSGTFDWELLAKDLTKIPNVIRDSAGSIGDIVHGLAEELFAVSLGNPKIAEEWMASVGLSPNIRERMELIVDFLHKNEVEVLLTEQTMYNDREGYAGTCDLVCRIGGRPTFLDIKTGTGIYPEAGLQLNAYAFSEYYLDDDDMEIRLEDICDGLAPGNANGGVLHIPASGKAVYREVEISKRMFDVFRVFLWLKRSWYGGLERDVLKETKWKSYIL